jgi:hypothetical protein
MTSPEPAPNGDTRADVVKLLASLADATAIAAEILIRERDRAENESHEGSRRADLRLEKPDTPERGE